MYISSINHVFKTFGFNVTVKNGSSDDFSVSRIGDEGSDFLFGEGKAASMLPLKEVTPVTSRELCLFGFATLVARTRARNDSKRVNLQSLLNIQRTQQKKTKVPTCAPSDKVETLLNCDADIRDVAAAVNSKLNDGAVDPHDAVNLWAAVMQACFYSVSQSRKLSIVMSSRMMWCISFQVEENRCFISVSEGTLVGSEGYLNKLISLLTHAASADQMSDSDQRLWDQSLSGDLDSESSQQDETVNSETDSPSGQQPPTKRGRTQKSPDVSAPATTSRGLPTSCVLPADVSSATKICAVKTIPPATSADESDVTHPPTRDG